MRIGGKVPAKRVIIDKGGWFFLQKILWSFLFPSSLRVFPHLSRLKRASVFPLWLYTPTVPAFGYQNWKDAGENIQIFPAPGKEPSRESKVKTRGLPEAPRLASQRGYALRLFLLTQFWVAESVGEAGEEAKGRRRGVWWKEQKSCCQSDSSRTPVSSLTSSGLFSPLWKLGQHQIPHRVTLSFSLKCFVSF